MQSYSIGREETSNVVIHDPADLVSRRHATLTVNGRKMTITDHSTNGTYINGIRIASNTPVPVSRGDIVNFAQSVDLDWNTIPGPVGKNYMMIALSAILIVCFVIAVIHFSTLKKGPEGPLGNTQNEQVRKDSTDTAALKNRISSLEVEVDSVAAMYSRETSCLENLQKQCDEKADCKGLRELIGVCQDVKTLLDGVDPQTLKNDVARVKENLADGVKETSARVDKLADRIATAKQALQKAGDYTSEAIERVKELKNKAESGKKAQPSKKKDTDTVTVMNPQPIIVY